MRILILNWRDIKNPSSGGAEILTHEIAKRWVSQGHSVTQFSSTFKGAESAELIDGVKVIRRGHPDARYLFNSVHFKAFWYYVKNFRGKIDVVIDEVHGLPFFTPFFVQEKIVVLICEVAGNLWVKLYGPIFGTIGRIVENCYLRFIYRSLKYLTISDSTRKDLINKGVNRDLITVLPMGITKPEIDKKYKKEKNLTLLYVGRLSKSKGIEDTILGFKTIVSKVPGSTLWIVGRGEDKYTSELKKMIDSLHLLRSVEFFGFVTERKKFELMSRAHILVSASLKEGFGLTIPEAGSVHTPAIVYRTAGLSDIVIDGKSGIICKKNTPQELSHAVLRIWQDKILYGKLSEGAYEESKKYSWNKTSKVALSILSS